MQFLIVGVVRNCAKTLAVDVVNISRAFSSFGSVRWFVVESDSTDDTLEVLENLRSRFDLDFSSMGALKGVYAKRTERISFCRNIYLDYVEKALVNDDNAPDFVVVVDLDGVNNRLSSSSVEQAFRFADDWDVCFPNQVGRYYDIWALRHEFLSPNDCWEASDFLQSLGVSRFKAESISVYSRFLNLHLDLPPIQVNSAFGGLAIYKSECFFGGRYVGLTAGGFEICEHVFFHSLLVSNGFRLLLIPSFLNGGLNFHSFSSYFATRCFNLFLHKLVVSIRRLVFK